MYVGPNFIALSIQQAATSLTQVNQRRAQRLRGTVSTSPAIPVMAERPVVEPRKPDESVRAYLKRTFRG